MSLASLAAWCAALFLAASLFSHTVALRLILLAAGVAFAAAAAARSQLGARERVAAFVPPLIAPFALWAAWAALSLLWSLDPELTGKELRNEIGYTFFAYWLCYAAAQAPGAARIVSAVVGVGALAVGGIALQYVGDRWHDARNLHGGQGTYSSALLILFPCTLAFLWLAATRRWHRLLVGAATVLLPLYAVSGYGTQNRTLWIGIAVQVVMFAFFVLGRRSGAGIADRRGVILMIAIGCVAVAGAAALINRVQSERRLEATASTLQTDPRLQLWQSTLKHIEQRPLAGSGFGRGMARHELRDETANVQLWHSHNLFLDTALQVGLVGLALLLLLLAGTLRLAWRLLRCADDTAAACGIALAAVTAGMLIRNMTDVLWIRQAALLYWGCVGTLLGLGLSAARRTGAAR